MVHGYENAGADTIRAAIRQDPMSITLDGPAIFTLATSLVLSVHFFQPSFITLIVAVVPVLLYVKNDFKNYLNLGPGKQLHVLLHAHVSFHFWVVYQKSSSFPL